MKTWCAALALCAATSVHAQGYPAKAVTMIVPVNAGGPTDVVARTIATRMAERMTAGVVVENRVGAGGVVGSEAVVRAAPDGHTVLMGTSALAIFPHIYKQLRFDPAADLAPIALVALGPLVLTVHPTVAANSLDELIALAKKEPGKLTYGSAGNGSNTHLGAALFTHLAGIDILHVPYTGSSAAMKDLLGGRLSMSFDAIVAALPHIKAGKLRALGVSTDRRLPWLPDTPTLMESKLPDYEFTTWFALFAPKGTPAAVIERLSSEVERALTLAEIRERFGEQGLIASYAVPAALGTKLRGETDVWRTRVQRMGLKFE